MPDRKAQVPTLQGTYSTMYLDTKGTYLERPYCYACTSSKVSIVLRTLSPRSSNLWIPPAPELRLAQRQGWSLDAKHEPAETKDQKTGHHLTVLVSYLPTRPRLPSTYHCAGIRLILKKKTQQAGQLQNAFMQSSALERGQLSLCTPP